jgi:hypothetical protein
MIFLILLTAAAFFLTAYLLPISCGDPQLKIEVLPIPPWNATSGQTLSLSIRIVNDAWPLAAAKNVRAAIEAPVFFTIAGTDSSSNILSVNVLRGGEEQDSTFNLTVSNKTPPGDYNTTFTIIADNVPQQTLIAQVKVTKNAQIIIPLIP